MRCSSHAVGRAGLTLVELVVAVLILAIGILGVSASMGSVARQSRVSFLQTRLRFSAQSRMEMLLASQGSELRAGEHLEGDLEERWEVIGFQPGEIWLAVRRRQGGLELADTLSTLVGVP